MKISKEKLDKLIKECKDYLGRLRTSNGEHIDGFDRIWAQAEEVFGTEGFVMFDVLTGLMRLKNCPTNEDICKVLAILGYEVTE